MHHRSRRQSLYLRWQIQVFLSVYIGYASFLFMRKSFSYVVPSMLQDPAFASLTKEQVGGVGTALGFTYAVGKLVLGGIMADLLSPKWTLFVGLVACSILNAGMSACPSLGWMTILWALNGLFQGGGWGPCAKLLIAWFPKKTRGTWWGLAATSQSVGAGLCAVVCAYFSQEYGWGSGMIVPGLIGLSAAGMALLLVKNSPTEVGLPPVQADSPLVVDEDEVEKKVMLSPRQAFMLSTMQKDLLALGVATALVYIVRQSISDWAVLYMVEMKGMSIVSAGNCIAWFEIGGIAGTSSAGFLSDKLFNGKRSTPSILFIIGLLFICPMLVSAESAAVCSCILFALGFFLYGPQMLFGVQVVEAADSRVCATAQGVAGVWAGIGSMVAGFPVGMAISMGWHNYFSLIFGSTFLMLLVMIPVYRIENAQQKRE